MTNWLTPLLTLTVIGTALFGSAAIAKCVDLEPALVTSVPQVRPVFPISTGLTEIVFAVVELESSSLLTCNGNPTSFARGSELIVRVPSSHAAANLVRGLVPGNRVDLIEARVLGINVLNRKFRYLYPTTVILSNGSNDNPQQVPPGFVGSDGR